MKPEKSLVATIGLLLALLYSTEALAQIALVKNLPVNSTKSTGTSLAITLTSGVTAGNSIIVSFAMDPASGTVSCTDSASNNEETNSFE